jgi:hypothetical protein
MIGFGVFAIHASRSLRYSACCSGLLFLGIRAPTMETTTFGSSFSILRGGSL